MKSWEYFELPVNLDGDYSRAAVKECFILTFEDTDLLDFLGSHGWELVVVNHKGSLIFKRRLDTED